MNTITIPQEIKSEFHLNEKGQALVSQSGAARLLDISQQALSKQFSSDNFLSSKLAQNFVEKEFQPTTFSKEGTGIATTEQMAEYYEVPVGTVKSAINNNRDELESDGLKTLRKKELKDVVSIIDTTSSDARSLFDLASKTSQATAWTPRAALPKTWV